MHIFFCNQKRYVCLYDWLGRISLPRYASTSWVSTAVAPRWTASLQAPSMTLSINSSEYASSISSTSSSNKTLGSTYLARYWRLRREMTLMTKANLILHALLNLKDNTLTFGWLGTIDVVEVAGAITTSGCDWSCFLPLEPELELTWLLDDAIVTVESAPDFELLFCI